MQAYALGLCFVLGEGPNDRKPDDHRPCRVPDRETRFHFARLARRGRGQRRAHDFEDRLGAFDHARLVPMPIDLVVEGCGISTTGPESRRQI
jgi:hypothetical protein